MGLFQNDADGGTPAAAVTSSSSAAASSACAGTSVVESASPARDGDGRAVARPAADVRGRDDAVGRKPYEQVWLRMKYMPDTYPSLTLLI